MNRFEIMLIYSTPCANEWTEREDCIRMLQKITINTNIMQLFLGGGGRGVFNTDCNLSILLNTYTLRISKTKNITPHKQ